MFLEGPGLDEIYGKLASTGATSYLRDALGSTIAVSNSSAATTSSYAYSSYGSTVITGTADSPFQYTARENDAASNLYYYRARYYSPQLGRFISEDPIGLNGGINAYEYASGNPIDLRDPLGLWTIGDPISDQWFDYSVGVADGLSFGAGRFIRSFTRYANDVNTCSLGYKAGVLSGVGVQALIGTGAYAVAAGGQSFVQSLYLSSQLLIGGGELTGATAVEGEVVEALYTAGELESETATEIALRAIRAASTLRSTTPALW
jgi:RHS repeat-associated protein